MFSATLQNRDTETQPLEAGRVGRGRMRCKERSALERDFEVTNRRTRYDAGLTTRYACLRSIAEVRRGTAARFPTRTACETLDLQIRSLLFPFLRKAVLSDREQTKRNPSPVRSPAAVVVQSLETSYATLRAGERFPPGSAASSQCVTNRSTQKHCSHYREGCEGAVDQETTFAAVERRVENTRHLLREFHDLDVNPFQCLNRNPFCVWRAEFI